MINCNPETVSTDYDTSDRLYFEPLTRRGRRQRHRRRDRGGRRRRAQGGGVARWTDAAEAGVADPARAGGGHVGRRRSTRPRTARSGTRCATSCASRSRRAARPSTSTRRWRSSPASASRCWCARATCSAAGRCASSTTSTSSRRVGRDHRARTLRRAEHRLARARGRPLRRAPGADRPLPVRRHRGRRRRGPRPHRRRVHRRRDGARRGGRRALRRLGVRDPAADAGAVGGRGHRGVHARRSPSASTSAG